MMKSDGAGTGKKPGLKKTAWIVFSLFFLTSLLVAAAVVLGPVETRLLETARASLKKDCADAETARAVVGIVEKAARAVLWAVLACLCGSAAVYWLVISAIFRRLEQVTAALGKIACGRLDETAPEHSGDEIGRIGVAVNEMAANLQEVLLSLWNHCRSCLSALDRIGENAGRKDRSGPDVQECLRDARRDLEEMRNMIRCFDFYEVGFDGDRPGAPNEPESKLPNP